MLKKNATTKMPRRDFLAASSLLTFGTAMGFPYMVPIADNEPSRIAPPGATIVSYKIFPTIGICRIGNSSSYFLGPEIPGKPPLSPSETYKETQDGKIIAERIKKQAQRFRVYGYDEQGRIVGEVTENVEWSVKVANCKAGWYEFKNPMDMGDFAPGLPGELRNNFFVGENRKWLEISPEAVKIKGQNINVDGTEESYKMIGDFWKPLPSNNNLPKKVKLGDVRTDAMGRLIVVPGDSLAESAMDNNPISNFADNDGWYDDWADGWVRARINGQEAAPAWVACCGPNFAPEIEPFITMYDVVRDVMVNGKKAAGKKALDTAPEQPSFVEDIYPLFRRLGLMEWVSAASNLRKGWIDTESFLDPSIIRKLCNSSKGNQAFREKIFGQFRSPEDYHFYENASELSDNLQYKVPYMLGSGINYDFSPAHWFAMPQLQYDILKQWAAGNFKEDLPGNPNANRFDVLEDIPLDQQPMALTRAALEPLSGGAFHPGVELTWPMRQQGIYRDDEPYRIKTFFDQAGKDTQQEPPLYERVEKLGLLLTPEVVFGKNAKRSKTPSGESFSFYDLREDSPVNTQYPGDLTRWLGLPWTPDAFSCQFVMFDNDFPNAAWWPALLPINVLPQFNYEQLKREDLDDETKLKFFNDRQVWTRGVPGIGYHVEGSYSDGLKRMISLVPHMGFVRRMERPENLSKELNNVIPEHIYVEMHRGSMDILTNDGPNQAKDFPKH